MRVICHTLSLSLSLWTRVKFMSLSLWMAVMKRQTRCRNKGLALTAAAVCATCHVCDPQQFSEIDTNALLTQAVCPRRNTRVVSLTELWLTMCVSRRGVFGFKQENLTRISERTANKDETMMCGGNVGWWQQVWPRPCQYYRPWHKQILWSN